MPDLRKTINAAMQALIDGTYGCLDAAAETINARNGTSSTKGTLSKRLSGQLAWSIEEIWALEDAAGRYPVSNIRARQMKGGRQTAASSVYAASGVASKEAGEAISAALQAAQSADAGDLTSAIQEAMEGEEAMRHLRVSLEARAEALRTVAIS